MDVEQCVIVLKIFDHGMGCNKMMMRFLSLMGYSKLEEVAGAVGNLG